MSDNPPPDARQENGAMFALPGHRVVTLEGPDAVKFAQAQFMSDVAALRPGQWQWSGWLTPKGRVIALFSLLRCPDESVALVLPDSDADAFATSLGRFVFRSKVAVRIHDDLHAAGSFAPPAQAAGNLFAGDFTAGIELDLGADGCPRTLRISATQAEEHPSRAMRWTTFDITHGLPRLPPSQAEQWTPQQLSLDRLRAYSVRKGCYPGQEIVARTHFLGQAKRGLGLFDADREVAVGTDVVDGERTIGTVVSCAAMDTGCCVLAVLPQDIETAALLADGVALIARTMLGGLAR